MLMQLYSTLAPGINNTIMGPVLPTYLVFAATAVAGALSSVRVTFVWEP